VVKDPRLCSARPVIRGIRIEVATVAWQFEVQGRTPDEIVDSFPHLSLAQVHAAIAYYYDRRDEIEGLWRREDAAILRAKRRLATVVR
jgi:uncharacterized protein (DUF433 family)